MKAVSDVVASVILIMIVVVAFFGIVWPLYLRYQLASQSAVQGSQRQALASETLITPVYQYATQSNGQTVFYVYLYNYGKTAFTPTQLIVSLPSGNVYSITGFSMYNAQSGESVSSIPPSTVVEVVFSVSYSGAVPSCYNLTAVGSGISLTWEL